MHLEDTFLRHGTNVEGDVGSSKAGTSGVGTSGTSKSCGGTSRAGGFHTQDPRTRSPNHSRYVDRSGDAEGLEHHVLPHHCTSCGNICHGPVSQFRDDGLLRYVSKTHSLHIIFYLICHSFQHFPNLHRFNYLTIYVKKYTDDNP